MGTQGYHPSLHGPRQVQVTIRLAGRCRHDVRRERPCKRASAALDNDQLRKRPCRGTFERRSQTPTRVSNHGLGYWAHRDMSSWLYTWNATLESVGRFFSPVCALFVIRQPISRRALDMVLVSDTVNRMAITTCNPYTYRTAAGVHACVECPSGVGYVRP